MKNVLIPTDFTPESLQLLEYALLNYPGESLHIVLVHGFRMPESKWGQLHFSARREERKLQDETFRKAVNRMLKSHSNAIGSVETLMFTGHNSLAFKNTIEPLGITDAVVPKKGVLRFSSRRSFDPSRFIRKCIPATIEASMEAEQGEAMERHVFSFQNLLNLRS